MCYGTGVLTYIHMETHTHKKSQFKNKSNAPNFILLHLTYLEANQKASVLPLCINSCTNNTEPQASILLGTSNIWMQKSYSHHTDPGNSSEHGVLSCFQLYPNTA